jgi:hypothetical protein
MRADMAKVIVERPRFGSRAPSQKKGYLKYIQRTVLDNLPHREPMMGRWRGRGRFLNEHLGPMRRFLRSNVGRPWNKVHQELCEYVSFDNAVQAHVLAHISQDVRRHVEVRGREVFFLQGWRYERPLQPGEMYVCPATGLLKLVRSTTSPQPPQRLRLGQRTQYHRRDDAWWELQLKPMRNASEVVRRHAACRPRTGDQKSWDVWLERVVSSASEAELELLYGGKFVCFSKRLLTNDEARQLIRRSSKKQRQK